MSSTEEAFELRRQIPIALDIHLEVRRIEDVKANENIWTCAHCGQPLILQRLPGHLPFWRHNPNSNSCVLKTDLFTHKTANNIKRLDSMIMRSANTNHNPNTKIIVKCTIYDIMEIAGHYVRDRSKLVPKELPLSELMESDRYTIIDNNYTDIARAVKENGGLILNLEGELYGINHPGVTVETDLTDVEKEMIDLFHYNTDYLKNKFSKNLIVNSVAAYMKDKHVRPWLQEHVINRLKSLEYTHNSIPYNELSKENIWRFITTLINEAIGEQDFEIRNIYLHFSRYENLNRNDRNGRELYRFHIDYIKIDDTMIFYDPRVEIDSNDIEEYSFSITLGLRYPLRNTHNFIKLYKINSGTIAWTLETPEINHSNSGAYLFYYFKDDEKNVLPFHIIRSLYKDDIPKFNTLKYMNMFDCIYTGYCG